LCAARGASGQQRLLWIGPGGDHRWSLVMLALGLAGRF